MATTKSDKAAPRGKKDVKKKVTKKRYQLITGLEVCLEQRLPARVIGPHGIGKTSSIVQFAKDHDLEIVYLSGSNCTVQDLFVPYPEEDPETGERSIQTLPHARLMTEGRKILVIDEASRAPRALQNVIMELSQERSIAGIPIPGLEMTVLLDNPVGHGDYTGIADMDAAQADRFVTFEVTAADIPWREFLAGKFAEEIEEEAMERFLAVYDRWDGITRHHLSPRTLEQMLELHVEGLPMSLALPYINGRVKVLDKKDADVTDRAVGQLYDALGAAPMNPENIIGLVDKVLDAATRRCWNVRLIGAHGRGKTSFVKSKMAAATYNGEPVEVEYLSVPLVSPQDLYLPIPAKGVLEFLPADRMLPKGRRFFIVADEYSRGTQTTSAAMMELVQERSLGGVSLAHRDEDGNLIEGLVGVIALDNPPEIGAIKYDAGRIDLAQASRFTATLDLSDADLPWREYLETTYGEAAQPFCSWRAEDLDEAGRALISPRCLERMIKLHKGGADLRLGIPYFGAERVQVDITTLIARLNNKAKWSFGRIIRELDTVLEQLSDEDIEMQTIVGRALGRADLVELKKHQQDVVRLVKSLPPQRRLPLINNNGEKHPERKLFFVDVLKQMATLA